MNERDKKRTTENGRTFYLPSGQVEAPNVKRRKKEESAEKESGDIRKAINECKCNAILASNKYETLRDMDHNLRRLANLEALLNREATKVDEEGITLNGIFDLTLKMKENNSDSKTWRQGYRSMSNVLENLLQYLLAGKKSLFAFDKHGIMVQSAVMLTRKFLARKWFVVESEW